MVEAKAKAKAKAKLEWTHSIGQVGFVMDLEPLKIQVQGQKFI
jgi:hypothetical protein